MGSKWWHHISPATISCRNTSPSVWCCYKFPDLLTRNCLGNKPCDIQDPCTSAYMLPVAGNKELVCPHKHHFWLVRTSRSETRSQSSRMSLTACLFKTYSANPLPFTWQYICSTIEVIHTPTNFSGFTYIHSEQLYHRPLNLFLWILYLVHHL